MKDDTADLIKKLREKGYEVRKKGAQFSKHSFETESETLTRFFEIQRASGRAIKDCHTEALADWCAKYSKKG